MRISRAHTLSFYLVLPLLLPPANVVTALPSNTEIYKYLGLLTKQEKTAVLEWRDRVNSLRSKTLAKTDTISIKEERLFNPSDVITAFPNSCVILTGETGIFDFERLLEVPYMLSIGVASANELKNSSSRLVTSVAKTIRQQLIIHGDDIMSYTRRDKPKLKLFPLTVVVVNIKLPYMADAFPPILNVIEAFKFVTSGHALVYCLSFDLQSHKMVDGRLFCPFCEQRKESKSAAGVSRNIQWNSQLKYGQGTVHEQMHWMRSNVILDGMRLRWSIDHGFPESSLILLAAKKSLSTEGTRKCFNAQLGLDSIILKTLFPTLNRTLFPIGTAATYDCMTKKRSSVLHCGRYSLVSTAIRPALTISLHQEKIREQDIIFISSENTKEADGVTAADLFLKVVTFQVWMALLFSLLATATICILCDIVSRDQKNQQATEWIAQTMKRLVGAGLYLLVGFLGQYNGELLTERSTSIHLIRSLMFPWLLLHLLLPIWYTTFLQLSFSFNYPYELETKSWQGFENYSVYFLESDAQVDPSGKQSPHFYALSPATINNLLIKYLYWDMNNFNDSLGGWTETLKIFEETTSFRMEHFLATSNPLYQSSHTKEDIIEFIFKTGGRIQHPADYPLIVWFKDTLQSLELCIARNSTCNPQYDYKCSSQCLKEKYIMWKMMMRHDHTVSSQLGQYVGQRYQDTIRTARRQGQQIKIRMEQYHKEWEDSLFNYTFFCFLSPEKASIGLRDCTKSNSLNEQFQWLDKMRYNITRTFYWMVKRPEAVFVVTRSEFPWYWPLFQKFMRENPSLKFAHTGPIALRHGRRDKGLGGNGFESPVRVQGPIVSCLPEVKQMIRRIRAVAHSGILGLYAKWNMILHPPLNKTEVRAMEEVATEVSALEMEDEIMGYTFGMLIVGAGIISALAFLWEACWGNWKSVLFSLFNGAIMIKNWIRVIGQTVFGLLKTKALQWFNRILQRFLELKMSIL